MLLVHQSTGPCFAANFYPATAELQYSTPALDQIQTRNHDVGSPQLRIDCGPQVDIHLIPTVLADNRDLSPSTLIGVALDSSAREQRQCVDGFHGTIVNGLEPESSDVCHRRDLTCSSVRPMEEAWIDMMDDREWSDPTLVELRKQLIDQRYQRVDNILGIHSLDPAGMAAHLALYRQAMKPTASLPKVDREMIAVVVSGINECHY